MSIKKQYLKNKATCKTTFKLPKAATKSAKTVHIVGEFNSWKTSTTPLKKSKNGEFSVTLDLKKGREYQFRYLLDGVTWENDWNADKYVPSFFGDSDNSVVTV